MMDTATRERLRCCTATCSFVLIAAVVVSGMFPAGRMPAATAAPVGPAQDTDGPDPAAEVDDGAGTADGADAGDSSGSPVVPLAAGGALLAGLVVGGGLYIGRRRKKTDGAAASVGELPPSARAVPLQIAPPAVGQHPTGGGSLLEMARDALRGAGGGSGLPPVNRLEVTPDTVDVVLAEPGDPPVGFTAAGPNRWRNDRRSEGSRAFDGAATTPVPALAPVGFSGDGTEVFVDLEASGLVVVDGAASDVAALLRGLVPAIVSAPPQERADVLLVGIGGTIVDGAGVRAVDTLAEALDRAEAHAHRTRAALEATGAVSLGAARVSGAGGGAWTSLVVVSTEQPTDMDSRRRLRDLALRRSTAVAFVTPPASGILPGRQFSVRDGWLLVDGFDEPVRPRLVSEDGSGGTVSIDVGVTSGGLLSDDVEHPARAPVPAQDGSAGDDAGVPAPFAGPPVTVPENAAPTLDEPTPPALVGSPEPTPSSGPVETEPAAAVPAEAEAELRTETEAGSTAEPAAAVPAEAEAEPMIAIETQAEPGTEVEPTAGAEDERDTRDPLAPTPGVVPTNGGSDPGVGAPTLETDPPDSGAAPSEREVARRSDIGRSAQVFAGRAAETSGAEVRRPAGREVGERQVEDLPGPATMPVPVVMFDVDDDEPLPPPPSEPRPVTPPEAAAPAGRSPFAPPTPRGAGVPASDLHRGEGNGHAGDAALLPETVAVLVRVLGHVEVARITPERRTELLTPPRPKALEAVVYLALRENGADREALEIRLFPDGTNVPKTMYNTISAARALLGEQLFPPPMAGRYRLGDEVATDYGLFRDLVTQSDVTDDPVDAAAALKDALRLVRGEPFMGPGRNYAWAGPHRNMIMADVMDAAERLAEIHLAQGAWQAAEWAARQGLRAFPQDERLYRLLMRSAAGSGNSDAVRRVYNELCTQLREPGEELDPNTALHPETLTLLAELTSNGP